MKTQRLPDGTEMPALGLGTWKSEPEEVYRAVRHALEVGYHHIDCAAIYQNEADVGRALADAFAAGAVDREDVWITSKLWNDSHDPEHVRPALDASLRTLRLDYLDLYLIHWPVALRHGVLLPEGPEDFVPLDQAPLEKTWEAMLEAAQDGATRQAGVSNFNIPKIERVRKATGTLPAVNQVELHPYLQQRELVEECRKLGTAVTAYSPLGSPDSAEMLDRDDDVLLIEHPTIERIAGERSATPGQVLIAWALERGTSVIPKSTNQSRIEENLGAQDLELDDDDMKAIGELDAGRRMIDGSLWFAGKSYSPQSLWED